MLKPLRSRRAQFGESLAMSKNPRVIRWSAKPWHFLCLVMLLCIAPAHARRIALVVGNAAYAESLLKNPVNDARAMQAKLQRLDFEVTQVENLKREDIGRTVNSFASKIRPGDDVVVFYAGHGVQVKGGNYLPAVDAKIQSEEDVPLNSLNLSNLLDRLDEAKAGVKILLLDACRNNPYARGFRSGTRGLARIQDAPSGTLMHFATRPGSVAADGSGDNGLYTTELLRSIEEPGVPIELMLKRVSAAVEKASKGQQEPWVEGSLKGDFYFKMAPAVQVASVAPVPAGVSEVAAHAPRVDPTPNAPVAMAAASAPSTVFAGKKMTLIVPFVAGGPVDSTAKTLAPMLSRALGATVVVSNVPGEWGATGTKKLMSSTPDGLTLMVNSGYFISTSQMNSSASYQTRSDVDALGLLSESPLLVVSRPGRSGTQAQTYASAGSGTLSHLCGERELRAMNPRVLHVPYKGGSEPAVADLIAGRVDIMCDTSNALMSHVRSGKLQVLGITKSSPLPQLNGMPVINASVSGETTAWVGLFAPKGMSADTLDRLSQALKKVSEDGAYVRQMAQQGRMVVKDERQTPAGFRRFIDSEWNKWAAAKLN
ncbi:hypothetical protein G7048_23640 [Diaphorobacter sp. HDW4B]|uniref:tripartite tricarboxylate transporter substrate-binding protein n=1 Tax=Diaphorobacter sp. HDW4B TaxID=2714925 RepID=UPI00140D5C4C|nr:tripartite tricarboxylate transporter substrate-binding protein [Diaphorobacter sp. HDW4B]QIL73081.1 hypothetical protein G7048_23640 [Diaphorobacter sp. HDW4B]